MLRSGPLLRSGPVLHSGPVRSVRPEALRSGRLLRSGPLLRSGLVLHSLHLRTEESLSPSLPPLPHLPSMHLRAEVLLLLRSGLCADVLRPGLLCTDMLPVVLPVVLLPRAALPQGP